MRKREQGIVNYLRKQKRILLAGNGISDAQKIQWNDMLRFVQKNIEEKENSEEDQKRDFASVSPTLFFEALCKKSQNQKETEKKARKLIKKYVADKSNFIHKLWNIYNVILTTNFDNNLVISKADIHENDEDPKEKKLTYENEFLYRRLDFTYENAQKAIFFIHGYFKNPSTICLGFEQYTKNLEKIQNFVIQDYSEKNYKKRANRKSVSWIEYFFKDNTTIDILGLSLCDEEIDLWWILNYRKKILNRISNNIINYYDLPDSSFKDEESRLKHSAKMEILKSFGIEVTTIENAEKYNSDFYSLCLKKIKV